MTERLARVWVQVRFTYEEPDTGDSIGSFGLRRFKLSMSGRIFADWKYELQADLRNLGDRSSVDEDQVEVPLSLIVERRDDRDRIQAFRN